MNSARWTRARTLTILAAVPLGAVVLAIALGSGQAAGQTPPGTLSLSVPHRVGYGATRILTGWAARSEAGRRVQLQAAAPGSAAWRRIAMARIGRRGRFDFRITARRSMLVRAVELTSPAGEIATAAAAVPPSSRTRSMTVTGRLTLADGPRAVFGSGLLHVAGRLLPARSGRVLVLQGRSGHAWHTLGRSRTGRRGRFSVRARVRRQGERLRVVFAGDAVSGAVGAAAGRTAVFTPTVVSWYEDGGQTGCGFHAVYGVANKTLPCGTRLTFRYGGRTVTATVDDRGPYVGGRSFDLNQNTAAALGFQGVGTVWVAG